MIRFHNVNKIYENLHQALKNVAFHLKKGEMAFLTGPSGAGKSTLLKLIMKLETPSHGEILINGKSLSTLKRNHLPYLRREVGVVFQTPRFLANQTIAYNVGLPLVVSGYMEDEMQRRVRGALDKVGLLHKAACLPDELSTGEQQRVGIARAIVNRPPLLIADEPTGNLDPKLSLDIIQLFEAFHKTGVTVLIATHDVDLIAGKHGRIFSLKDGQLDEAS